MKKWFIPLLLGLFLGLIFGILLGLFALDIININANKDESYGVLEVVYYLVTPIGVLATFLAIVVALWGNEFKNYLFRERCISKVNKFAEILKDEDDPTPEASRYECHLEVKNDCAREISECCVKLIEVMYEENESKKWKNIGPQNRIPIYWKYPELVKRNLSPDETVILTLLKITPDISQSKSDSSSPTSELRHLSIVGYKGINQKYTKKGCWKLTYCVSNSHRELERFKIVVKWTGEWKNREKEMDNELSLEFEKIN